MKITKLNIFKISVLALIAINVFIIVKFVIPLDKTSSDIRIKNEGAIAFGAYDENGIIDTGTLITEKEIEHKIEVEQNLPGKSKYLLMVLVDYAQMPFHNDGAEIYTKKFELEANGTTRIGIKYTIPDDATDLCYLIIKEPDYQFESEDLDRGHILQQVITMQYKLSTEEEIVNTTDLINYSIERPIPDIFLSQNMDELKVCYFMQAESKVFLTVGNNFEERRCFAVIKLLNWEQIEFEDSHVKYIELESGQKGVFEDYLPSVESDSNIQYISFPYALEVNVDKMVGKMAEGTFRLKIVSK